MEPQIHTLTVTKSGSGTVTSNPSGINCGTDCSEGFSSGVLVTLTASASSGSTFAGWGGACSGTGSCQVTMTAAQLVTATFTLDPVYYTLHAYPTGTGSGTVTSSPPGISCPFDCSGDFLSGTTVTLTALAASGSTFEGWFEVGRTCSGPGPCEVLMDANGRSELAVFTLDVHTLSVEKSGQGTVSSSPSGIQISTNATEDDGTFLADSSVTLTATPASGWEITDWSGACDAVDAASTYCIVDMYENREAGVTFEVLPTCGTTYGPWLDFETVTPWDENSTRLKVQGPLESSSYCAQYYAVSSFSVSNWGTTSSYSVSTLTPWAGFEFVCMTTGQGSVQSSLHTYEPGQDHYFREVEGGVTDFAASECSVMGSPQDRLEGTITVTLYVRYAPWDRW